MPVLSLARHLFSLAGKAEDFRLPAWWGVEHLGFAVTGSASKYPI